MDAETKNIRKFANNTEMGEKLQMTRNMLHGRSLLALQTEICRRGLEVVKHSNERPFPIGLVECQTEIEKRIQL